MTPPLAPDRILDAARRRVAESGAAELSMQDVAKAAGVSKALIHYHFRDKEALLARLVVRLGDAVIARERAALDRAAPQDALDALWEWLDHELRRGDVRVLLDLSLTSLTDVREASRRVAAARRETAAGTVERVFALLALTPRVPAPMLAEAVLAFTNGLALGAPLAPQTNPRIAFDVFWLALLGMAE